MTATFINRVLRKLHMIAPPFDENDMLDAETEDKQREHNSLMQSVGETFVKREELNDKLRESIKIARESTASFADFERLAIRRREQGND